MKKPKFAFSASLQIFKDEGAFDLVDKTNHRAVGVWALECTERVMPYFEKAYPYDPRPRNALTALRGWIDTGAFSMRAFRQVALPSHAVAKERDWQLQRLRGLSENSDNDSPSSQVLWRG